MTPPPSDGWDVFWMAVAVIVALIAAVLILAAFADLLSR